MKKYLSVLLIVCMLPVFVAGCDLRGGNAPTGDSSGAQADNVKFIGEDKAKEIALEKVGIPADGVVFDRIELDYDDGRWEYEVEFRKDKTEYDVVVGAEKGDVISFESDIND